MATAFFALLSVISWNHLKKLRFEEFQRSFANGFRVDFTRSRNHILCNTNNSIVVLVVTFAVQVCENIHGYVTDNVVLMEV
jgi:hypothetical protein